MIEVIHVNKSFDSNPVLKDVSTTFKSGMTNMIIGKSGSGKTVLMKCIIGLYSVDSGKILLNGQNLTEMTFQEVKKLRQKVGMLFQGAALFDSSTVLENVLYPLEMFSSMSKAEQIERASFCLHRVNIDPKAFGLFPSENQRWNAKTGCHCQSYLHESALPLLRRTELRSGSSNIVDYRPADPRNNRGVQYYNRHQLA